MAFTTLMTRALSSDGEIISIEKAMRGLSCDCRCIVCGSQLVARKGEKNRHSFAHDTEADCRWSGETELHILAKEVLEQDKGISFKHFTLDGQEHWLKVEFLSVEKEVRLDHLIPDIQAITSNGEPFIIEICVHHHCEVEKIHHYRSLNLNAIEVTFNSQTLKDVDYLTHAFVRKALENAKYTFISKNPLSVLFEELVEYNKNVLKQQGQDLQKIVNEIRNKQSHLHSLKSEIKLLKSEIKAKKKSLSKEIEKVNNSANSYYQNLIYDIESRAHIVEYRSQQKLLQERLSDLKQKCLENEKAITDKSHENIRKLKLEVGRLRGLLEELHSNARLMELDAEKEREKIRLENKPVSERFGVNGNLKSKVVDSKASKRSSESKSSIENPYARVRG